MARPASRNEVQLINKAGDVKTVIMTSRQANLFDMLRASRGRVVHYSDIREMLALNQKTLLVEKCKLNNMIKGYYEIGAVSDGGYMLTQV